MKREEPNIPGNIIARHEGADLMHVLMENWEMLIPPIHI